MPSARYAALTKRADEEVTFSCLVLTRTMANLVSQHGSQETILSPRDSMYRLTMEPFCASGDTPGVGSGYAYLDCLVGLCPLYTRG